MGTAPQRRAEASQGGLEARGVGAARRRGETGPACRRAAARDCQPHVRTWCSQKRAYATRMPCEYLIAGVQPAATRSRLRPATCARGIGRDTHAAHSSDREAEAPRCSCTMTGVSTRTVSPLATSCVTTRRPSTTFTAVIEKTRCGLRPPGPRDRPSGLVRAKCGDQRVGASTRASTSGSPHRSPAQTTMRAGLGRRRHPRSGNPSGR